MSWTLQSLLTWFSIKDNMPVATTIRADPSSAPPESAESRFVPEKEPPATENANIHMMEEYLRQKLRFLHSNSKTFEHNMKTAHETMDHFADAMKNKADEMRKKLTEQLEAKHARRLNQVDEECKMLEALQGQLQQLPVDGGDDVSAALERIRQQADECVGSTTTEDSYAYSSIYVGASKMYKAFMELPPNYFFGVCSIVTADIFKLRMVTSEELGGDNEVWMEVFTHGVDKARVPNRCPKTLLPEFSFEIEVEEKENVRQKVSFDFKEMQAKKNVIVRDTGFFFMFHPVDPNGDVVVHVKFGEVEVLGSPQVLSLRKNKSFRITTMPEKLVKCQENEDKRQSLSSEGKLVGQQIMSLLSTAERESNKNESPESTDKESNTNELEESANLESKFNHISISGNVTRTGKSNIGLDDSDMRAMGIINKTGKIGLTTVQEVSEKDNASSRQDPTTVSDAVARMQQQHLASSAAKVIGSPSVFKNQLSLDCPSPNVLPKSGDEMVITSTTNNLGDLKNINVPDFVLEEVGGAGDMLEVFPGADVSMLQKDLSGEGEDEQHHRDIKNKSVSFHPDTKLREKMKFDNTLVSVKKNEKKNDTIRDLILGRGQNGNLELTLVQLNKWVEEEDEGEDHSQCAPNGAGLQQPTDNSYKADSCWNYSQGAVERHQKEVKKKYDQNRPIIPPSDVSQWSVDDSHLQCEPYFDLASSNTAIHLHKSISVKGTPQSVSRHLAEAMDLMLVADAVNHRIHKFAGWKSLGVWAPKWPVEDKRTFLAPRSVLCMPDDRVAVLDNRAIYIFKTNGSLLKILFDGETTNFRGLAFYTVKDQLITTEAKEDVVNLVFVDILTDKGVVNKIPLEPTRGNPDAKIRFVTYKEDFVYATDLSLGQYYATNLTTGEIFTHTYTTSGTNKLKYAAGVAVDPAGNVLVASAYHKTIQVFNRDGFYCRSLFLGDKMEQPTGIWLHGCRLLVVDTEKKTLNIFIISDS